jgi:NRAMP (natural resistance-associated macrophage protein)-like metal ion transporter
MLISVRGALPSTADYMTKNGNTGTQVAYLDPGNWATAIESGSRFGYRQLWVLVLANLIAIQLQTLSSRLGLVSGKHLAQVCRDSYPPVVCRLLWLMTEVSIVALDLTMVLGAPPALAVPSRLLRSLPAGRTCVRSGVIFRVFVSLKLNFMW